MTIAQAGLAFRVSDPIEDLGAVVSSVLDEPAVELAAPVAERFDIRNPGDVMVQSFGDVCFLCNDPLVEPLLCGADASRVHRLLGAPSLLIAFRHDDAADNYGYAVFERGARRRTRVQSGRESAASESGSPLPFERRWLAAEHFVQAEPAAGAAGKVYYLGRREVLVPERRLTGRMLQEGLETHFDVCPWETLITPTYRFFRVEGGAVEGPPSSILPGSGTVPARKKAWWRRA